MLISYYVSKKNRDRKGVSYLALFTPLALWMRVTTSHVGDQMGVPAFWLNFGTGAAKWATGPIWE